MQEFPREDQIEPWVVVDGDKRHGAMVPSEVLRIAQRENLAWPLEVMSAETLRRVAPNKYLGPSHEALGAMLANGKLRFTPEVGVLQRYFATVEIADLTVGKAEDSEQFKRNVDWLIPSKTQSEVREAVTRVLSGPNVWSFTFQNASEIEQIAYMITPERIPNEAVVVGSFEFGAKQFAHDVVSRAVAAIWANEQIDDLTYAFYTEPLRREVGPLPSDRERQGLEQARTPIKSFFNDLALSTEPIGL